MPGSPRHAHSTGRVENDAARSYCGFRWCPGVVGGFPARMEARTVGGQRMAPECKGGGTRLGD